MLWLQDVIWLEKPVSGVNKRKIVKLFYYFFIYQFSLSSLSWYYWNQYNPMLSIKIIYWIRSTWCFHIHLSL